MAIGGAAVLSAGLLLDLVVLLRRPDPTRPGLPLGTQMQRPGAVFDPDALLRFGVELADGTRVTTLDAAATPWSGLDEPERPRLQMRRGGGGSRRFDHQLMLTPLPPDGPLTFACAWPAHNLPESKVSVDLSGISAAAAQVQLFWPDDTDEAEDMAPKG